MGLGRNDNFETDESECMPSAGASPAVFSSADISYARLVQCLRLLADKFNVQHYTQIMVSRRVPYRAVCPCPLPGTGKTLLARAIASNIDANFLKVGHELRAGWV